MTEKKKTEPAEPVEPAAATPVAVGDQVTIKATGGLAVLPDGSVVTCHVRYTIQHEGRHLIDGVAYDATAAAEPVEPVEG